MPARLHHHKSLATPVLPSKSVHPSRVAQALLRKYMPFMVIFGIVGMVIFFRLIFFRH